MKSSKDTKKQVDIEKVEILVDHFLDVIEGLLNTIDHIAEANTETKNGQKVIEAARFRMNIRKLKVKLLQDLKRNMTIDTKKD